MIKMKEDLDTIQPSDEEIRKGKETALKILTGVTDLDTSNLSDEDLDKLIGKTIMESSSMSESINSIVESMQAIDSSFEDIAEEIHVQTGMKLTESKKVVNDIFKTESNNLRNLNKIFEKIK